MSSAVNPLISGIDPSHIDNSFRPQDDLYRYLNGQWLKSHEIAQDRSSDGVTYQLFIEAEAQVPLAMAEAFRKGNLGIMDYQKIRNISADTEMRASIAKDSAKPNSK